MRNSKVYLSNPDGDINYANSIPGDTNPSNNFPQRRRGRRLAPSKFISRDNRASNGASFIYAIQQSDLLLKGMNLQSNYGIRGGVISIADSKLVMVDSMVKGGNAAELGGFLYSTNSYFDISESFIRYNEAPNGAVIHATGVHTDEDY